MTTLIISQGLSSQLPFSTYAGQANLVYTTRGSRVSHTSNALKENEQEVEQQEPLTIRERNKRSPASFLISRMASSRDEQVEGVPDEWLSACLSANVYHPRVSENESRDFAPQKLLYLYSRTHAHMGSITEANKRSNEKKILF